MDLSGISNDICFGTIEDIKKYETERKSKCKTYSPAVNPLKMSPVIAGNLPKKKDPWCNKKEFVTVKRPSNVSLPRSKMPWEK